MQAFRRLVQWLKNSDNRGMLAFFDAIVAALGSMFVYFAGKSLFMAKRQTFQVCMGEYSGRCLAGSIHIACKSDLSGWAKRTQPSACYHIESITPIQNEPGNECGYATLRFECKSSGL
jgi:hypothetical protein